MGLFKRKGSVEKTTANGGGGIIRPKREEEAPQGADSQEAQSQGGQQEIDLSKVLAEAESALQSLSQHLEQEGRCGC